MKKSTLLLFLIVLLFGFGGYFFFAGEESSESVPINSDKDLVQKNEVTKKVQTKTTSDDTKSDSDKKFAQSNLTTNNNSNIQISTGFKKIPLRDRIDLAMEQEFQMTHDPATNTIPKERLWKVYKELKEVKNYQNKTNAAISGVNWIEHGPTNQGGRTRAILVDPNDASGQTVFAAGVSGGIWKTTNISDASPTWTPIDEFMANIGVTCLVADPSNPQIMYAGTGEGYFNIDAGQGDGIFKSTDGGDTWSQLANTSTGISSHFYYVQNIVVNSAGDILAATRSRFSNRGGIQKSTDGGASWNVVLDNNTTGIASTNRAADIVMASNGDLYAAMGIFSTDGVYKSTTSGASWTKVYDATTAPYTRIKLAPAPSNSSIVYAMVQSGNDIGDIIKTTNGGTSWSSTSGFSSINWLDQCSGSGTDFSRGQAWYDMALAVDPNDPNVVWAGGVDMFRTTNGGANWTQITEWANCSSLEDIHADQHIVIYKPGNSDTILVGNDGGIYRCNNAATGSPTFTYKGDNYRTLQLYSCAIHPTAGSNHFLGGAQDNGSHKYSSSGLGTTVEVTGGDGAFCHIDQTDPTYQFTAYVYNNFRRSTNGGTSFSNVNVSSTGKFINPSDYDNDADIMYSSYNSGEYLRWDDPTSGTTFNSVNPGFSGQVSAVTCDPNTSHRVWFGTDDGSVYRVNSANTGTPTSTDLSPTGMGGSGAYVSCIEIEDGDANHIVVTYSNYGVNSVWETTNGGSSWTNIEGNLPDMPIRWALFNPLNNNQLLLATELGVWSTDNINGGTTVWGQTSNGMANVRVDMLQYRTSDNTVIAGTHGRGMYSTKAFSPFNFANFQSATTTQTEAGTGGTLSAPQNCMNYVDVVIPLEITKNPTIDDTIDININGASTATTNVDFALITDTLIFTTTGAVTRNVIVRIFDDGIPESSETIVLDLSIRNSGTSGISNGTIVQHIITLNDNDYTPDLAATNTQTVGTSGSTSGTATPFRGTFEDEKMQIIYRASELTTAGFSAGDIYALAFNINSKASSIDFQNFTISIATTASTNLGGGFESPAFTTCFSGTVSTVAGWNTFDFTTPFTWDGSSNLLVQVCFDNAATSGMDEVVSTDAGYTSIHYRRDNGQSGCAMGSGTGEFNNTLRPDTRFTIRSSATIQSAINPGTANSYYLGANQTVHFYDASGNIIATIQNGTHDFGCTTIEVNRAGTGAVEFWDNTQVDNRYDLASKTYLITADNNDTTIATSANYTITLYYTQAEVNGWESAISNFYTWTDAQIVKSGGAIANVTPANHHPDGTITVSNIGSTSHGSYDGTNSTITYTFTNGFSGFGVGVPGAEPNTLPIELLSFNGTHQKTHNLLNWETTSEINNTGFEIERSKDGESFSSIGYLKSKSVNNLGAQYDFLDYSIQNKTYYYRLKQVDLNGDENFSDIVEILPATNKLFEILNIYPNPAEGKLYMNVNLLKKNLDVKVELLDIASKIVLSKTFSEKTSGENTLTLNVEDLNSGAYFIRMSFEDQVKTSKFIKK